MDLYIEDITASAQADTDRTIDYWYQCERFQLKWCEGPFVPGLNLKEWDRPRACRYARRIADQIVDLFADDRCDLPSKESLEAAVIKVLANDGGELTFNKLKWVVCGIAASRGVRTGVITIVDVFNLIIDRASA